MQVKVFCKNVLILYKNNANFLMLKVNTLNFNLNILRIYKYQP